jgi:hypothetical protein
MPPFYVLLTLSCYTRLFETPGWKYAGKQYNFSPEKVYHAEKLCENIWG